MVAVDTIGIFLADDHAMVREGLAALVETDKEIEVIGQCGDGLKVVTEVLACNPDVVTQTDRFFRKHNHSKALPA